MSTLWTPGGERPVGGGQGGGSQPAPDPAQPAPPVAGEPQSEEELAARMDELRQQLAEAPAEVVIANHCFGLFELAALHLSQQPPTLEEARLAIDALGALVEGLSGRLGEHEAQRVGAFREVLRARTKPAADRNEGLRRRAG